MDTNNSRPVATRLVLGLILIAGLVLRLWYGGFGLRMSRFEDEKHSWPNVQSILETGTLAPQKTYYPYPLFNVPPAALIAAAEKLSSSTEEDPWSAVTADGTVTPRALFLCRAGPIFYGTVAILLTFLMGQLVFSTQAGLIGALLLAFSPQAIHSSGYFKPDSQLLCMTLLALFLALRAVERPTLGRYALAGLGVTLAASSKAIGVAVAAPLVVASLITGWRRPRDFLLLGIAGLTSALSFVLTNPYWYLYPEWLANIRYHYEIQAQAKNETQATIPWRTLKFLLGRGVQNPWLSGTGVIGLVGLIAGLGRKGRDETQWLFRWMFLVFPIVYVVAYALTTAYFKANNFLVLLPYVFLASGWVLSLSWWRATEAWEVLRRPAFGVLAWSTLAVVAAIPGLRYTYTRLVPPTHLLAKQYLASYLRPPDGRLVFLEDPNLARPDWEGWPREFARKQAAFKQVDSAAEIPLEVLQLADGVSLTSASIERSDTQPLARWLGSLPPGQVRTFEPELFRSRGPSMTAAFQSIERLEAPLDLEIENCPRRPGCLSAALPPDFAAGGIGSLIVYVRDAHFKRGATLPEFRLGGKTLNLTWAGWKRSAKQHHFISGRFVLGGSTPRVVIRLKGQRLQAKDFRIELCRWRLDDQS